MVSHHLAIGISSKFVSKPYQTCSNTMHLHQTVSFPINFNQSRGKTRLSNYFLLNLIKCVPFAINIDQFGGQPSSRQATAPRLSMRRLHSLITWKAITTYCTFVLIHTSEEQEFAGDSLRAVNCRHDRDETPFGCKHWSPVTKPPPTTIISPLSVIHVCSGILLLSAALWSALDSYQSGRYGRFSAITHYDCYFLLVQCQVGTSHWEREREKKSHQLQ